MKKIKISDHIWEIPTTEKEGMRVPARIYGSQSLIESMDEGVFEQVTNVAKLPGIRKYAFCMPDGHWGYGFPIGGVAAFSMEEGVISPGGIGFDINCGVRLLKTDLTLEEVEPKKRELLDLLFHIIPAGVGAKGLVRLTNEKFKGVMVNGAGWCVENGYGEPEDLGRIEQGGKLPGAKPEKVSKKAFQRGMNQLGTLGSGNHYLELQVVKPENIYDGEKARVLGFDRDNQITVMIHCGSRGFGHQVATDYLFEFNRVMPKYGLFTGDKELACAPYTSPEGQDYYGAMACAANSAFANRQVITHRVREGFSRIFGKSPKDLGMEIVYDVAHNIAKIEEYELDGKKEKLIIHRKGATRSFGSGHPDVPERYRSIGQPVIVGGSMESPSYLLVGTTRAEEETFGSTCHGAGRTMSRSKAKKMVRGWDLKRSMEEHGILVRAVSMPGLAEEAGIAYKDISEVVEAVDSAGLSKKVLQLLPIANIKG